MSIILREIRRNLYIFFQGCKISEDLAPIVKASRRRVAKQWRRLAETLKSGFCLGLNLNTEKLSVYERICSKIKKKSNTFTLCDRCAGWNRFCNPGISTDYAALADYCLTAQNSCVCVNCNVVFDCRMALFVH